MKKVKQFLLKSRAKHIVKQLIGLNYFLASDKILDIGSGSGYIAEELKKEGINITLIDVVNYNQTNLPLRLFYGRKLPFKNKEFDFALMISVLHHSFYQRNILKEAKRVAKKVIILEDVFTSNFSKFILYFIDFIDNYIGFGKYYSINKYLTDESLHKILSRFKIIKKQSLWNRVYLWRRSLYVYK